MSNLETKECPLCGEKIILKAIRCKHCRKWSSEPKKSQWQSLWDGNQPRGFQIKKYAVELGIAALIGCLLSGWPFSYAAIGGVIVFVSWQFIHPN